MYIARQLSFHGVTFDIREVTISDKFREMFDASVELVSQYRCTPFGTVSTPYPTVDGSPQIIPWSIGCTGVGSRKIEGHVGTILGLTSAILQVSLYCSQSASGCEDNTKGYCRWEGKDFFRMVVVLVKAALTVCSYWTAVYWRGTYTRTTGAKSWNIEWFCFNRKVSYSNSVL